MITAGTVHSTCSDLLLVENVCTMVRGDVWLALHSAESETSRYVEYRTRWSVSGSRHECHEKDEPCLKAQRREVEL